ncbi:FBD-associated F-box protein At4g13985, partial [Linum grandiflorum]
RAMKQKARKRRCRSKGNAVDRLSELPDCILTHILSFLITKDAVQTSVLSRRWRSVWKYVPVIDLDADSFRRESYKRYYISRKWSSECLVDTVLSLRHDLKVDKICLVDEVCNDLLCDSMHVYHRVVQYAHSHYAQHLVIGVRDSIVQFSELFGSVVDCNLKTLELGDICFDSGAALFQNLTTLKLVHCLLNPDYETDHFDLSVNFPCLLNLDISKCQSTREKVYLTAPQLINLRLSSFPNTDFEIVAPRLRIVSLDSPWPWDILGFPTFSLSYVDRAEVYVDDQAFGKKTFDGHLNKLYPGLINAKTVVLRCHIIKVLKAVRKFLEQKLSSFTKLESLVCVSGNPSKVATYLIEESSGGQPNSKRFRRQ